MTRQKASDRAVPFDTHLYRGPTCDERPLVASPHWPDQRPIAGRLSKAMALLGYDAGAIFRDELAAYGAWVMDCDGVAFLDLSEDAPTVVPADKRRAFDEGALDVHLLHGRHLAASDAPPAVPDRREQLQHGLEGLAGRFPDHVDLCTEGLGLVLETHNARMLVSHALRLGLRLGLDDLQHKERATVTIQLRASCSRRAIDFTIDVLRRSLKHMEAGLVPEPVSLTKPKRRSRVMAVDADQVDALLPQMLALEASIFEPERRDPPEKLRMAFDDPDGIAVIAEVESDGEFELAGFSLAVPLETIEVDGADQDFFRGARNTLYAVSTTLGAATQGLGLGLRIKQETVAEARRRRGPSGEPRYRFITGRNRVGATAAMQRVNARLGAYTVATYEGQYGGEGKAIYYRMPVGPIARIPEVRAPRLESFAAIVPLSTPPKAWTELLASGALSGSFLSGHRLGRSGQVDLSPMSVHALERLARHIPTLPRVSVYANESAALSALDNAHCVGVCPEGWTGPVVESWQDAPDGAWVVMETISRVTGERADVGAALAAGCKLALLETTGAFGRTGVGPLSDGETTAHAVIWACGENCTLLHGPAESHPVLQGGSEFELLWASHVLSHLPAFDHARLAETLAPLGARGHGAYWVVAAEHRAALAQTGCVLPGKEGDPVIFAPPLDLDEANFLRLEVAVRAIVEARAQRT